MPHVSKNKLEKEVVDSIERQLRSVLADIKNERDVGLFLGDLLTRTELTMLAKRLAIAIMFERLYPFRVIRRTLKVSESTISAMRERIDRNGRGFEIAIALLYKSGVYDKLLRKLDKIISLFAMPPIAGKNRWKFLDDLSN